VLEAMQRRDTKSLAALAARCSKLATMRLAMAQPFIGSSEMVFRIQEIERALD